MAGMFACAAQVDSSSTPAAQTVAVAVDPTAIDLAPGQKTQFAAAVTGTADVSVVWSVEESGGGVIDQTGLYTAPQGAGTFHVRVTSHADSTKSAVAAVTVAVPPAGTVSISPKTATVVAGGTLAFTATVTGITNPAVTWSVQEASGCGSVTSAGSYTAPAAAGTCHVVATSVGDTTKRDVATVTVTAPPVVVVTIAPRTATVVAGGTVSFTATVTGTSNSSVSWSVQEASGCGTVSSAGVYTAPASAGTCHVVVTSAADRTKTDVATVTVSAAPVVAVTIAPKTATVVAGGTVSFTATVTGTSNTAVSWSVQEASGCGSVSSAGVYTAPAAAATCHVVTTSAADRTKTDVATVTVTAAPVVTVTVAPATATVDACRTLSFTATVTGTTNQSVTWSVAEGTAGGTVSTAGLYTAPSNAGTYHVVATSPVGSATGRATVTVQDHILSVTVQPGSVTVGTGNAQQFTATVTTSCGAFTSTQVVAAP